MSGKGDQEELSADDLALIAAFLDILADGVALWAVLKARDEKLQTDNVSSVEDVAPVLLRKRNKKAVSTKSQRSS